MVDYFWWMIEDVTQLQSKAIMFVRYFQTIFWRSVERLQRCSTRHFTPCPGSIFVRISPFIEKNWLKYPRKIENRDEHHRSSLKYIRILTLSTLDAHSNQYLTFPQSLQVS